MAKPFNEGLKSFPLNVDAYCSDGIKGMQAEFKESGFEFIVKLLGRIYRDGYYIELDDYIIQDFCDNIFKKPDTEFARHLDGAIRHGLFDAALLGKYNILTSSEIQKTYLEESKRWRKVVMVKDYVLKDVLLDKYKITMISKEGSYLFVKEKVKKEPVKQVAKVTQLVIKPAVEHVTTAPAPLIEKPIGLLQSVQPTQTQPDKMSVYSAPGIGILCGPESIKEFCSRDYSSFDEAFKKEYDLKIFNDYISFNNLIDKNYLPIRLSARQMSIAEYKALRTEPVNPLETWGQEKPTKKEITEALIKLTSLTGINTHILSKTREAIRWIRTDIKKQSNR